MLQQKDAGLWARVGMTKKLSLLVAGLILATLPGCGGSPAPEPDSGVSTPVARTGPVSMDKADYPVFPDADAGADPSVPAEQGGKGFTGQGWETNTDFDLLGDPHAVKGGVFRDSVPDFPGTFRTSGPDSNTYINSTVAGLVYETLLGLDSRLEYMPSLATHWQISADHMTFRFRLNPNARFSDGTPVTSEDVVATYDFMMDKTLQDPSNQLVFGKFNRPVAESRYIIRVHAKDLNWRNFLYFGASMPIMPAHVLKDLDGTTYLRDYNYKMVPGSGPYVLREEDIAKGRSFSVRRRNDYWAAKARGSIGTGNFDELRFIVVRDDNLLFEMFKKGEVDAYVVKRSPRQWAQELNFDNVQRGLIQKRKVFNGNPQVRREYDFNTRVAPFDDIRVRKAFTFLLNRSLIVEKIMFNEYQPLHSFYAGMVYENPDNPKNEYNPQEALRLLAEAGWNSRDSQGRLVKNGVPLQIEMLYRNQVDEPHLTIYQEELRKVGINLNLRLVTFETEIKMVDERRFQMAQLAWGGLLFPNPETSWHSTLADQNYNNNITGFKNARVDELCALYDTTFDVKERIRIIQEIDGIVANAYHHMLLWSAPSISIAYWDKFGMPPGILSANGDEYTAHALWWYDPDKDARLQQALRDPSIKLDVGPMENRYWIEYARSQQTAQR